MNTSPNTTTADPDVPLPAGATADDWPSVDHDGVLVRSLEWCRYDTDKVGVSIDGSQRATGEYTKGISFYGVSEGQSIDSTQARELAAALIKAADELDGPHAVDSTTRNCTTNENVIVICADPDEKIEVICTPFEPHHSGYAGERWLAIFYRGTEEAFVVLTAEQATRLAELLTGQDVTR